MVGCAGVPPTPPATPSPAPAAPLPDLPQRRNAPAAAHALQGIRRCGSGGDGSQRVPRRPQRRHAATPLSLAGMGVAALRQFRAGAGPCGRRAHVEGVPSARRIVGALKVAWNGIVNETKVLCSCQAPAVGFAGY